MSIVQRETLAGNRAPDDFGYGGKMSTLKRSRRAAVAVYKRTRYNEPRRGVTGVRSFLVDYVLASDLDGSVICEYESPQDALAALDLFVLRVTGEPYASREDRERERLRRRRAA